MRDRALLAATAAVLLAGVAAASVRAVSDHVGPARCTARVARSLNLEIPSDPEIVERGDAWTATVPSGRLVLRVTGVGHRVTGVAALAGPGADVLERAERLRALATRC